MKANKKKLSIAMANALMNAKDLQEVAKIPRPTLNSVIAGKEVRPATIGKVAKALGVNVTEIIE